MLTADVLWNSPGVSTWFYLVCTTSVYFQINLKFKKRSERNVEILGQCSLVFHHVLLPCMVPFPLVHLGYSGCMHYV